MTYPGGGPVFPVKRIGRVSGPVTIHLNEACLARFGEPLVPRHLWRALQRFYVWIEPAFIAEWSRLMAGYAEKQGRKLSEAMIDAAMTWSEPGRDVRIAREQAVRLIESGKLHCVWSGRALSAEAPSVTAMTRLIAILFRLPLCREGQDDAVRYRLVGRRRNAVQFHLRQDHDDRIPDMGERIFAGLAADHSAKMARRGTNGLPFVAGSGSRHKISNDYAASSCMVTGANASESRRPRVGNQARSVRGKVGSVGVVRANHSLRTSAVQFPAFAPCQTAPR